MKDKFILYSLHEVAAVFGVTEAFVKVRRRLSDWPCPSPGQGRRGEYDLRLLVPWWISVELREALAKERIDSDDPLLVGNAGDSPALERYRLAKAKLAERELDEKESRLVDVGIIRDVLANAASRIRKCGETLERRWGVDAFQVLDDAVKEHNRVTEKYFEGLSEVDS